MCLVSVLAVVKYVLLPAVCVRVRRGALILDATDKENVAGFRLHCSSPLFGAGALHMLQIHQKCVQKNKIKRFRFHVESGDSS